MRHSITRNRVEENLKLWDDGELQETKGLMILMHVKTTQDTIFSPVDESGLLMEDAPGAKGFALWIL